MLCGLTSPSSKPQFLQCNLCTTQNVIRNKKVYLSKYVKIPMHKTNENHRKEGKVRQNPDGVKLFPAIVQKPRRLPPFTTISCIFGILSSSWHHKPHHYPVKSSFISKIRVLGESWTETSFSPFLWKKHAPNRS